MANIGFPINANAKNTWREYGFRDEEAGRDSREDLARKLHGEAAAAAYRLGRKRAAEVKAREAADG